MRKNFIVPEQKSYRCKYCRNQVMGGRYNNHCPHCLWSKHVDQDIPGDRLSDCSGLMAPTGVLQKNGKWRIIHECTKCHKLFTVNSAPADNFDLVIKLSKFNGKK